MFGFLMEWIKKLPYNVSTNQMFETNRQTPRPIYQAYTASSKEKKKKLGLGYVVTLMVMWLLVMATIALFGKSFFPSVSSGPQQAQNGIGFSRTYDVELGNSTTAPYQKLVFMVVDAMRYDMVYEGEMEFTKKLLQESEAYGFIARAEAPTVTMPRIKAMMSGIRPSFMDFVWNLHQDENEESNSKFQIDNLLQRFKEQNKSIELYGDGTWYNLFPSDTFSKADPTSSLFVKDTVVVDLNVSRHMDDIFKPNPSWDVVILHFLGLDHIGHVDGAHSSLMGPKHREMDGIVRQIYDYVQRNPDTMFVLCSDHGMIENGNHGGASDPETGAFAMFSSKKLSEEKKWKFDETAEIKQVDMVPTIASLFHLGIPKLSMGKLIEPIFENHPQKHGEALYENMMQLFFLMGSNPHLWRLQYGITEYRNSSFVNATSSSPNATTTNTTTSQEKFETDIERVPKRPEVKALTDLYVKIQTELQTKHVNDTQVQELMSRFIKETSAFLHKESSNFDMPGLIFSLFCLAVFIFVIVNYVTTDILTLTISMRNANVLFIFIFLVHLSFQFVPESWMVATKLFEVDYLLYTIFLIIGLGLSLEFIRGMPYMIAKGISPQNHIILRFTYLLVAVLGFAMFSSSFIEEVHHLYFYFAISLLFLSYCFSRRRDILVIMVLMRISRSWNQAGIYHARDPDVFKWLDSFYQESKNSSWTQELVTRLPFIICLMGYFGYMASHCIRKVLIKKKEQDKKTGRLVVVDQYHKYVVSNQNRFTLAAYATMAIGSFLYHLNPPFFGHAINQIWGPFFFRIAFGVEFLVLLYRYTIGFWEGKKNITHDLVSGIMDLFFMLQTLIQDPSNLPLVALLYAQCRIAIGASDFLKSFLTVRVHFILLSWLGMCSYYTFGNSIAIANIDFGNAYVGLSSYQPLIVGFFLVSIVYVGPIAWGFTAFLSLSTHDEGRAMAFYEFAQVQLLLRISIVLGSCWILFLQRSHLFIWSVFSPNYLFSFAETVMAFVYVVCWLIGTALLTIEEIGTGQPANSQSPHTSGYASL